MLRRHLLINKMALMLHEEVPTTNIHIVCVLSIARAITAIVVVVIGTRTAVVSTVCSRLVAVSVVVVVSTVVVVLRAADELRRLELFEEVSLLATLTACACRIRFVVVRQTVDVHEEVG